MPLLVAAALICSIARFQTSADDNSAKPASFEGTVTNSKNEPVAGAAVLLMQAGDGLHIEDGRFTSFIDYPLPHDVQSDQQGHFHLASVPPPFLVVAVHETEGVAEILTDQISQSFLCRLCLGRVLKEK